MRNIVVYTCVECLLCFLSPELRHCYAAGKQQKKKEWEPAPKKIKLKINVPAATAAIAANEKKQKRKTVVADDVCIDADVNFMTCMY